MASGAEQIVGPYRRPARTWAVDRGDILFERDWLDRFLALLPVGAAVLDIGCGSGEPIGRCVIERDHAVTGVDSLPEFIGICEERFPREEWLVADMRTLSLRRGFGGLLAWDSFFHLCHEDQRRMLPVFREHAAPRAALMFTSGPAHGVAIGAHRGEPLFHASLDGAEYRALLDANGFDVVAHVVEDPVCGHHTVWLARLR